MSFRKESWSNKCVRSIAALLVLAPLSLHAQETSVIFEQSHIRIDPAPLERNANGESSAEVRAASEFNIELRSEDALRLEHIHTLNTLDEASGVMILFAAPLLTALPRMRNFNAVDALFIAEDGTVLEAMPQVVLAEQPGQKLSADPVKALLFLKAGSIQVHRIMKKDVVTGPMFIPGVSAPPFSEKEVPQAPHAPAPEDIHQLMSDEPLPDVPAASDVPAQP